MNLNTEYREYRQLTHPNAIDHPQRQGLSIDEYRDTLDHSDTVTTELNSTTGAIRVPLLAAIGQSAWNNTDFYDARYPNTNVMQLYLPEEVSTNMGGDQFKEGLKEQRVLMCEVPSMAVGGVEKAIDILRKNGAEILNIDLLGTQTYFEGKIQLNDPTGRREKPAKFIETFEAESADEESELFTSNLKVDPINGTWLHETLPEDEVDVLYDFYDEAYKVLNDSPLRQGLDPEEFRSMIVEDKIASKLVYRQNGKPQTVFLATEDIDGLDWVNSEYYKNKFPEEYENQELLWYPGIATDPEAKSLRNGEKIAHLMTRLGRLGGYEPRVLFDFCDFNVSIGLHQVFERWINSGGDTTVSFNEIADQKYYGITLA